jgi:hypothetical protein
MDWSEAWYMSSCSSQVMLVDGDGGERPLQRAREPRECKTVYGCNSIFLVTAALKRDNAEESKEAISLVTVRRLHAAAPALTPTARLLVLRVVL